MQLIATRTYRDGGDGLVYCDFPFRRPDGRFCIEEASGCEPHQSDSHLVEVELAGALAWLKYRPDQIRHAVIEGGRGGRLDPRPLHRRQRDGRDTRGSTISPGGEANHTV
jgi:hypothetical protein